MAGAGEPPTGYDHVACCVDEPGGTGPALVEAARLAALGGARLSLVHVADPPGRYSGGRTSRTPSQEVLAAGIVDEVRAWLEPMAAEAGGAQAVVLQGGDAAEEILAWARDAGCDVLVVHPRRRGVARAVLGSVAARIAREAPCPVMLVPA